MVFNAVGLRMGITGLPGNYEEWQESRTYHLTRDLACSGFTQDLYNQYRKHLGAVRYALLKQVQILLAPREVSKLLPFNRVRILDPLIGAYKVFRFLSLDDIMKKIILPEKYKDQILALKVG